jgi:hypothetical protein
VTRTQPQGESGARSEDEGTLGGKAFPDLRADFIRHLSICRDENFLLMVFAQNALQLGQTETARLVFRHGYPPYFANAILLDSWMTMVLQAKDEVTTRAEALAARDPHLCATDRIPILFTEIGDFENLVLSVDFQTYADVLRKAFTTN